MVNDRSASRRPEGEQAETAQQLLHAAAALMTERNTIDVPVADVAARAKLNAALVNYYFRTKTGLHIALVKRDAAQAVDEMKRLLASGLPPAEKMRRHLSGMIRTFYRYPYLYRLMRALMRDKGQEVAREIAEFFNRPVVETQRAILAEGVADGTFRDIDPLFFHLSAVGACDHLFAESSALRWTFGIETVDEDMCQRYAAAAVDLLMGGLLTEDGRRS